MTGTSKLLPRHFLLCMLFGLLAVSCENDESLVEEKVSPHNQDLPISVVTTTYEEAGEKFKQVSSKHELDNHIGLESHGSTQRRGDSPGIVIISEVVKVIKQGDYTSFTMLIEPKDIASNIFYNLTIEEVKGVTKMFITKYVPTEAWLENNNMPFHGQITTFRINDLQTALDRVDTPINGGGEGGGAMTYPTDCNGTVIATVIVNEIRCGCGHDVAENCDGCNISPQFPYLDYKTVYECVPNTPPPGGNPFTDPPGGTPGTTNPPGGGTGGGSGPGNTPPSPPGNDPSLTAPVGPKDGTASASTPCGELKKLLPNNSIQLTLRIIKGKSSSSEEFGNYFAVTTNSAGATYTSFPIIPKDPEDPTKLSIGDGLDAGNVIGAAHCHTDPVSTKAIPMFSPRDLLGLWRIARRHQTTNNQPKDYSLYSVMLSVGSGHYALKFKNFQAFENYIANIADPKKFEKDLNTRYYKSGVSATSDIHIKDFLTSINKFSLGGVGLYKATEETNTNGESIITGWKELSLNQNGTIAEVPCL